MFVYTEIYTNVCVHRNIQNSMLSTACFQLLMEEQTPCTEQGYCSNKNDESTPHIMFKWLTTQKSASSLPSSSKQYPKPSRVSGKRSTASSSEMKTNHTSYEFTD